MIYDVSEATTYCPLTRPNPWHCVSLLQSRERVGWERVGCAVRISDLFESSGKWEQQLHWTAPAIQIHTKHRWWFGTWLLFSHILGIRIPTVTHSIIFQRGRSTTNQVQYIYNPHILWIFPLIFPHILLVKQGHFYPSPKQKLFTTKLFHHLLGSSDHELLNDDHLSDVFWELLTIEHIEVYIYNDLPWWLMMVNDG